MRPSQIKRALALHDSGVQGVEYAPAERAVRIRIDLCNHQQPGYQPGEPEIVPGTLRFSNVTRVEAKPELSTLTWAEDRFDGEILEVTPLPAEAPDDDGVEVLIHTMDYRTHVRDVLTLSVFGGEVTWTLDT